MTPLPPLDDDDAPEPAAEPLTFRAGEADGGARLDAFLARSAADLSRARVKALIEGGLAAINGRPATDPSRRLRPGDEVGLSVPPPVAAEPAPEPIPLAVVYEDADLVVVDKPAGLVVHPGAGHSGGTLVNALLHHCGGTLSGIGGVERPGIVHRLDKDTSGLLVAAKSERAHRGLAAQFADHGRTGPLERVYDALAWGVPSPRTGRIDAPIGRHPRDRQRFAVLRAGGRSAVTHYRVEASLPPAEALVARLSLRLETGRTHQIRVHLAHLGHPLLGDPLYGAGHRTKAARLSEPARVRLAALGRQALHARVLAFAHPVTGEPLAFESPPPADMADLVAALGAHP